MMVGWVRRRKEDARVLNLIHHWSYSSAIILSAWKKRERNRDRHIERWSQRERKKEKKIQWKDWTLNDKCLLLCCVVTVERVEFEY